MARSDLSGNVFPVRLIFLLITRLSVSLTTKYFKEFNEGVFGGALSDVRMMWSPRLKSTAGVTKCSRRRDASGGGYSYVAVVELSTKVLDSESKLRQVCVCVCVRAIERGRAGGVSALPAGVPSSISVADYAGG